MSDEKKEKKIKEEISPDELDLPPVQMAIDPVTGKDITAEVVAKRLGELEILANIIIEFALWRWEENGDKKMEILKETELYLRLRIGQGSIGPATAAAGPLMYEKIKELYEKFGEEPES
ncbi:MAG: hypothetical protein ACTSO9_14165 [Candidatus Helarchaeota archaeon]